MIVLGAEGGYPQRSIAGKNGLVRIVRATLVHCGWQ
jgi:hypothetical protein